MKSKKIVMILVSILMIIALSVTIFATDSTNTTNSSVKNNTVEDKLIPALEEKLKEKENQKAENNVTTDSITDGIIEDDEKNSSSVEDAKVEKYEYELSEDVIGCNTDNIKYKNYSIDGNLFIASSKVKIEDSKVNGDIFIMADEIEIDNVEVTGNIFVSGTKVTMDVKSNSAYIVANDINISKETNIERELRICGNTVEIAGTIGRDVYAYASKIELLDEAKISGDYIIKAEESIISEEATIKGKTDVEIVPISVTEFSISGRYHLIEIATEFGIILVISLFILGGFPKFTEVNKKLRLRDFFKAFFTGILEIFIIFALAIALFIIGHGIGYAFALIILMFVMLGFGKLLFILAFAIRISGKSEKISKAKIFIMTIIVALVVEAINLISLMGPVGIVISGIFNMIIGISGFGSLIRVILTSKKKIENKSEKEVNENTTIEEIDEIQEKEDVKAQTNQEELKAEVKKEIAEEIKEMQEEREKEKEIKKDNNTENKDEK